MDSGVFVDDNAASGPFAQVRAFVNNKLLVQTGRMALGQTTDLRLLSLGTLARSRLGADRWMDLVVHNPPTTEECATELGRGQMGVVRRACAAVRPSDKTCMGCVAFKLGKHEECKYEMRAFELIRQRAPQVLPVVAKLLGVVPVDAKRSVLMMEAVEPFRTKTTNGQILAYPTLHHFLSRGHPTQVDSFFSDILYQLFFFVGVLQKTVPGFRHNDLHNNNIMLTNAPPGGVALSFDGVTQVVPEGRPLVQIIDFGLSWAADGLLTNDYMDSLRLIVARPSLQPPVPVQQICPHPRDPTRAIAVKNAKHVQETELCTIVPIPSQTYDMAFVLFNARNIFKHRVGLARDGPHKTSLEHALWQVEVTIPELLGEAIGESPLLTVDPKFKDFDSRPSAETLLYEMGHPGEGIAPITFWTATFRKSPLP